jgi:hypothetical protein
LFLYLLVAVAFVCTNSIKGLDPALDWIHSIFSRNVSRRYTTTRIDTHARRRRRRIHAYIRVRSCIRVIHTYSACTRGR